MKLFRTLVTIMLTASCGQAAAVRGIQAVLFMAWDDDSVDKLISTIAANSNGLPSNRMELGVLYITEGLPKHNKGASRGRWDNLQRVIDCLATVPAPVTVACPATPKTALDIKIRLFFDIHGFSEAKQADQLNDLSGRAADFSGGLFKKNENRVIFRLSPLLEETPLVDFLTYSQRIFDHLDGPGVCSSTNYPRLVRSPLTSAVNTTSETIKLTCSGRSTTKGVSVSLEWHGTSYHSGFADWSNDGYFVYDPGKEDSSLTLDVGGHVTSVKLADFISSANKFAGTALLWRPRYNLELYKHSGARTLCQSTPTVTSVQKLAYCSSSSERGTISQRIAATGGAVFDDEEAAVLKSFLTTLK